MKYEGAPGYSSGGHLIPSLPKLPKGRLAIGLTLVALAAVASQFTIVNLGPKGTGSLVLATRTGPLSGMRPVYDSDKAFCERVAPRLGPGKPGPEWTRPICQGSLAFYLLEHQILRWRR